MSQTKLTIKQIEEVVKENVKGVTNVFKQVGTNCWFIQVTKATPEEAAITLKNELGFKIVFINRKNNMILAEFQALPATYYGRMITNGGA